MPIKAQSADGSIHEFPDDTKPDVVDRAMKQYAQEKTTTAAPTETPKAETPSRTWPEVGMSAIKNAPSSAIEFGKSMAYPVMHPLETANTLLHDLPLGAAEKAGMIDQGGEYSGKLDKIGGFFKDRYGGVENIKNTLATDPVGAAADAATVLSGGGGLAARAPGIVGRVGEVASTAGRMVDPLSAVSAGVRGAGQVGSEMIGGMMTHTGGKSLRAAAEAGYEGGEAAKVFQANMRGAEPLENVVADARNAVRKIRQERGAEYREGMTGVGADKTVLDFGKIDDALIDVANVKTYKGQNISPKTQEIRTEIAQEIQNWRSLNPAEYHTAEGIDALKQKIGDIRDATPFATPQRVVADRAYQAIRQTIVDQVPEYAKVMKGYEEASKQIKELERALSLDPKASIDTALRKLQSVLRDNVNTNYGQRAKLAEFLVNAGAPNLMEKLAGQALSTWTPRGLAKLVGTEILATGAGALGAGTALGAAGAGALALPLMSPRLMGEASYYTGKAAAHAPPREVAQGAYQLGRGPLAGSGP